MEPRETRLQKWGGGPQYICRRQAKIRKICIKRHTQRDELTREREPRAMMRDVDLKTEVLSIVHTWW